MSHAISSLWRAPPTGLVSTVRRCVDSALDNRERRVCKVFFRADDVAAPSDTFARLMDLFIRHGAPLSLGVVPAWLSTPRWQYLKKFKPQGSSLFCWHQHGWRHKNHEREGKKQEFGPIRTELQIKSDLIRGRRRLEDQMGDAFYPVFSPPWNRCGLSTLLLLEELGYCAVSRSKGSHPPSSEQLPDFQVNVDLHTRKEQTPGECWEGLFKDLKSALTSPLCGIMIHHQRMNKLAFEFLEVLLELFSQYKTISLVHFRDLAPFADPVITKTRNDGLDQGGH